MSTQKKKRGNFEIGVNLRVTQCFDKGSRNYMEDFSKYYFEKDPSNKQSVIFAFFGVFDGHGGTEAAELAHKVLLEEIKSQEKFWSLNDQDVLDSIREGFLRTHQRMVDARSKWPLTPSGFQSTAGTTASIALIRNRKLYVGHVGDSAIVVGRCPPDSKDSAIDNWSGNALTVEHKPDHPDERRRIEGHGGSVRRKAGIHRVVWNRPKPARQLEATPEFEEIPFLAVARSLGDLWSFDADTGQFHVSPEPDCAVYDLRPQEHRCVIIGSDGLWNVIKPETAVELVRLCERETEARVFTDFGVAPNFFYHPAGTLVQFALERCAQRQVRSDNVTAVVVMVDPAGKPMTQLRQERRRLFFSRLGLEESADGGAQQGLVRRLLVESQRAHGDSAGTAPVPAEAEEEEEEEPTVTASDAQLSSRISSFKKVLMESSGNRLLFSSWTDACWQALDNYMSETGMTAVDMLHCLFSLDVKFRREAISAVPSVVSLKRAFTHDWEMSTCLSQLPVFSPEWTQLLVLCGASSPASPNSGSSTGTSPSRRWIDRRDRILAVLYTLLEQRPSQELSKEARGLMRAHALREEKARSRAAPLPAPELAAVIKDEPDPTSPPGRTRAQRKGAVLNGRPALRRGGPATQLGLNGASLRTSRSNPTSDSPPRVPSSNASAGSPRASRSNPTPESPKASRSNPTSDSSRASRSNASSDSSRASRSNPTPDSSRASRSNPTPDSSRASRSNPTPDSSRASRSNASTDSPRVSRSNPTPESPKASKSNASADTSAASRSNTSKDSPRASRSNPTPDSPRVSKSNTSKDNSRTSRSNPTSDSPRVSKSNTSQAINPNVPDGSRPKSSERCKTDSPESSKAKKTEISNGSNMPKTRSSAMETNEEGVTEKPSRTVGLKRKASETPNSKSSEEQMKTREPSIQSSTQSISPRVFRLRSQSPTSAAAPGSPTKSKTVRVVEIQSKSPASTTAAVRVGQPPQGKVSIGSVAPNARSVRQKTLVIKPQTTIGQITLTSTPVNANSKTTVGEVSVTSPPVSGTAETTPVEEISQATASLDVTSKTTPSIRRSTPTGDQNCLPTIRPVPLSLLIPPAQADSGSPPLLPGVQNYRSRKRFGHATMLNAEAEAEVNNLMRKLVVTFTPDPEQLKNFERRPSVQADTPKPRPIPQPNTKPTKPQKEVEKLKDEDKKEKSATTPTVTPTPSTTPTVTPTPSTTPTVTPTPSTASTLAVADGKRCLSKRVVEDEIAEARLEEMMRAIVAKTTVSPAPMLVEDQRLINSKKNASCAPQGQKLRPIAPKTTPQSLPTADVQQTITSNATPSPAIAAEIQQVIAPKTASSPMRRPLLQKPSDDEMEAEAEADGAVPAKRRRLQTEEVPRRRLRLRTARSDV